MLGGRRGKGGLRDALQRAGEVVSVGAGVKRVVFVVMVYMEARGDGGGGGGGGG